jgi:hypothetical protein
MRSLCQKKCARLEFRSLPPLALPQKRASSPNWTEIRLHAHTLPSELLSDRTRAIRHDIAGVFCRHCFN